MFPNQQKGDIDSIGDSAFVNSKFCCAGIDMLAYDKLKGSRVEDP
jgi:hypothetical protein